MLVLFSRIRFLLVAFCVFFAAFGLAVSPVFAKNKKIKRYTIKSGEVHYKIEGSGDIMGTKMSSSGEKSLYFQDFGGVIMEEETVKESMSGFAGKEEKTRHSMKKTDQLNVYIVDFARKQISVGSDPVAAGYTGKNMGEEAEKTLKGLGGQKIGSDNVLGYACTVWTIMGGKQCLYKNQIPLWVEIDVMGVKTRETAVSAKFNHRISNQHFTLPDYPQNKAEGVFTEGMSPEEAQQMAAMMQAIGQASNEARKKMEDNPNMSEEELAEQMLSAFSQTPQMKDELKKMQHDMPIMLKLAKEYRKCLKGADNKKEAQACEERISKKSQKLGILSDSDESEEEIVSWSPQDKKELLEQMDKDIAQLEKALPCITKAKSIMEMMNCPGMNE